ncbi:radial spoke head protein 9 homolog [Ambystoma mexicanum]|uniref:radial spoke head protein 9 homolog n=1 Tax=Ambystoma mexicanum TaxID=8296 RepID=UPI0037E8ABE9
MVAQDAAELSMEAQSLYSSLELVSGCGQVLSPELRSALRTSLLLVQRDYHYRRVLLWGRIQGLRGDYYIARGEDEPGPEGEPEQLSGLKTLYSLNGIDWSLLPPATEEIVEQCSGVKGRFMGDPAHEYEYTVKKMMGEGDAAYVENITVAVKEESRLIATIADIEKEAAVVPRGAYIKTPLGHIQRNRSFQGLTVAEAKKLSSYFHFTDALVPKSRSLLEKADLEASIDFLVSLEHDVPKGSWSLQFERGNSVVVLRSLLWVGLIFYHIPMTQQHGYIYVGNGERNIDLPFML